MIRPSQWADAAVRHPWRTIGWWLAAIAVSCITIVLLLGRALDGTPGTTNNPESEQGLTVLDRHIKHDPAIDEVIILRSSRFLADDLEFRNQVEVTTDAIHAAGGRVVAANSEKLPTSQDSHSVLIPVQITSKDESATADSLVSLVRKISKSPDYVATVTGSWTADNDTNALSQRDLEEGELGFGLPVALLVLLLVFGTVVGALLPLLVALVAIIAALALAALVGLGFDISVFLVNMVTGMGLALGIDYTLFVLSRYREERQRGRPRDAAIAVTSATASRAVLFSGMTFVIALVGMLLIPTTIMRSLALGAILVGITSVIAALTLLPALLRLLGDHVDAWTLPWIGPRVKRQAVNPRGVWARLVRLVMRRPLPWALTVGLVLLALSMPVLGLKTGAAGVSALPVDMPSRQGFEALNADFPTASYNPARVVIETPDTHSPNVQRAIEALTDSAQRDKHLGKPVATYSDDNKLVVVDIPLGADARTDQAVAAVRHLRSSTVPAALSKLGSGTRYYVTGETAFYIDYFDVMHNWTLPVFAFVLGLSFVLLTLVFRSIVVPIKAILLNLLSVGATYGVLVLVFQHGYGTDLLGLDQVSSIEAWVPLFLFSVLFGLSMDYHMFLLTRIREIWFQTRSTEQAVVHGISTTARLISGAALIIIAVFAGFARGDMQMFQQMGFGIAIALLIDATLVRGILLPALMQLLGNRNWYLPDALQWIPEIQLEKTPSDEPPSVKAVQ